MSDFPSRIACIPSNDVINRWKNQLAKASDPDEQKRLTEMITEAEAGSVLNSANAGLESAEKLDGWNTQRAQIQVSMGAAKDNFERVKARLEKLPGADKETINRSIFNASSKFAQNAHSTWIGTLYSNESDDFVEEVGITFEDLFTAAEWAVLGVSANALWIGGVASLAAGSAAPLAEIGSVALSGAVVGTILVGGAYSLCKGAAHIWRNATNDDIEYVPECSK